MMKRYAAQRTKSGRRRAKSVIALWICLVLVGCDASPKPSKDSTLFRRSVPMFKRRLPSWVIRHKSQSKSAQRMKSRLLHSETAAASSKPLTRGSFLTLDRPTKERLFDWFGVEGEDPIRVLRCMMSRTQYNHNIVGITNPLLHVMSDYDNKKAILEDMSTNAHPYEEERKMLLQSNEPESGRTVHVSTKGSSSSSTVTLGSEVSNSVFASTPMERSWWPEVQVPPNTMRGVSWMTGSRLFRGTLRHSQPNREAKGDWRVIVHRKRIGKGRECYERVRDAALDWEFESADGSMGLLEVPVTRPRGGHRSKQKNQEYLPKLYRPSDRYTVRPADMDELEGMRSSHLGYRSLGTSSRRLVSYTSKAVAGFLPERVRKRLYVVNPVMVIYDVVDQRAQDCTFTSTAYATLKGHWLSGEERVSISLRDGSQDVDVEIFSISRSGPSLLGQVVWPFVGQMQSTFLQQHLLHFENTANAVSQSPSEIKVPTPFIMPRGVHESTQDPTLLTGF